MPDNQITLTVVVNGKPTQLEANVNAPLRTVIPRALEQTGNTGRSPDSWELKDEAGNVLNVDRKIDEFGFTDSTKLFLSLKAGAGGSF